jgi:hypothetical protein
MVMHRLGVFLPLVLFSLVGGCAHRVDMPSSSNEKTSRFLLVDYGYGSHLVLPRENGGAVLYSYGEWAWFAENRDSWYRVFPVLFWPTQGTLGRQEWPGLNGVELYRRENPTLRMWELSAPRERIVALVSRLDTEFQATTDRPHYNARYGLDFVKWGPRYHFLNNCNHLTVKWLEELGLEVSGSSPFSIWTLRIEPPEG